MPLGIPHSVFLGRLVRPGKDQNWTDDDMDKALAFKRAEAAICTGCGTRKEDWTDRDRNDPPFLGHLHYCPGCEVLAQERRNVPEGTEAFVTAGLVPAELDIEDDIAEEPPSPQQEE